MNPRYSLIIPFFNEAGNVQPLLAAVFRTLASFEGTTEILLIDDGSTDTTALELAQATLDRTECRVIGFTQNQGQAAALLEGLRQAQGDFILTLDGDGQNDPEDLARLLPVITSGQADLVCGIRTPRHDSGLRRIMSRIANAVRSRILRDGLQDAGCQLRVFRREIISALQPSPLLQAFLPAMAVAAGFRITEMPVRHHPRERGESKYGLRTLWWQPMMEMLRLRRLLRSQKKRP
ncbi:glycosyltransferase family 2 protein [Oleiharenicola lentus]|uniref:glycosyltransferase family 2 protein n=1 Tax=Oleiharenicola lentus TaxID=2508720 RepID=UPI003F66AB23